ncbi:MAG: signal recognition particle-docking protein FtsY [Treponema sp.]|nr:signal recognition particle-docking protein FtsY [Treponema sp.]
MKFGERLKKFFLGKNAVNQDDIEELRDLLIEGDFGAAEAYKITDLLKERCKKNDNLSLPERLSGLLIEELSKAKKRDYSFIDEKLSVILLLGVNGVGKTTTAAKLAYMYKNTRDKKVILAAADTFRAAAVDQLKIHGERLDTRVVAHKQGGDSAAVVYDALDAAVSGGFNFVIADTAGRMHTKSALVEELKKIDRVVEQKTASIGEAFKIRYLKFLTLDATTGRNAFSQAEIFHSAVALDGVILTKYDSTAKGGVVFSLASQLALPVIYVCTGEKYTDIEVFNEEKFAKEFTGIG